MYVVCCFVCSLLLLKYIFFINYLFLVLAPLWDFKNSIWPPRWPLKWGLFINWLSDYLSGALSTKLNRDDNHINIYNKIHVKIHIAFIVFLHSLHSFTTAYYTLTVWSLLQPYTADLWQAQNIVHGRRAWAQLHLCVEHGLSLTQPHFTNWRTSGGARDTVGGTVTGNSVFITSFLCHP